MMPPGVQLKMQGFTGLTDCSVPLAATLEVTGTLGTRTGHRLLIPGAFFEAQAKARFVNASRQNPVFLNWAYTVQDQVHLHLPSDLSVENRPNKVDVPFAPYASFQASYGGDAHESDYTRRERVSTILYKVQQYPALRDFFQKMNTQDQAQLVLSNAPAVAAAESR